MADIFDDGGPAFPSTWMEANEHGMEFPYVVPGMSLRQYYAGLAMAAIIGKAPFEITLANANHCKVAFIAGGAFEYADAMIAESKEPRL